MPKNQTSKIQNPLKMKLDQDNYIVFVNFFRHIGQHILFCRIGLETIRELLASYDLMKGLENFRKSPSKIKISPSNNFLKPDFYPVTDIFVFRFSDILITVSTYLTLARGNLIRLTNVKICDMETKLIKINESIFAVQTVPLVIAVCNIYIPWFEKNFHF